MTTRFKTFCALFASVVVLGSTIATFAAPASADSPDCASVCSFNFGFPPSQAMGATEAGLKFQSDIPGWIAGVCYWENGAETGNHSATLWDSSGTKIASNAAVTIAGQEGCIDFSPPVPIDANTTYTASYTVNTAYDFQESQFLLPYDNAHLHAPVNAGVLGAPGTFPTTSKEGDSYGVDVAFFSSLAQIPGDCTSTMTAPTSPSSAPGNAYAVVSWFPAHSDPDGCIAGYVVTPYLGDTAQPPTLITGPGTTTVIYGLTNGLTYTFTIAAESGRTLGPASTPTGPLTVGTPTAPTALAVASVPTNAARIAFKKPKSNGATIKGYTATCTSHFGASRSKSGKSSPLVVKGLTKGRTYRCKVRASNRRGTGPASRASAAVKG